MQKLGFYKERILQGFHVLLHSFSKLKKDLNVEQSIA